MRQERLNTYESFLEAWDECLRLSQGSADADSKSRQSGPSSFPEGDAECSHEGGRTPRPRAQGVSRAQGNSRDVAHLHSRFPPAETRQAEGPTGAHVPDTDGRATGGSAHHLRSPIRSRPGQGPPRALTPDEVAVCRRRPRLSMSTSDVSGTRRCRKGEQVREASGGDGSLGRDPICQGPHRVVSPTSKLRHQGGKGSMLRLVVGKFSGLPVGAQNEKAGACDEEHRAHGPRRPVLNRCTWPFPPLGIGAPCSW